MHALRCRVSLVPRPSAPRPFGKLEREKWKVFSLSNFPKGRGAEGLGTRLMQGSLASLTCETKPSQEVRNRKQDREKSSLTPRPLPSFLSLAVQALAQLPVACSPGPRQASHRLQSRTLPSFLLLAVQALAKLPIACSPGPCPASHRLQSRASPSFLLLAVHVLAQLPVACSARLERMYEQQEPTEEWNVGGRSHNDVVSFPAPPSTEEGLGMRLTMM